MPTDVAPPIPALFPETAWRKSSYSNDNGTGCVEIAFPDPAWRKSSHSDDNGTGCVEIAHATWRKSTHSNSNGTGCVELAHTPLTIGIRDSKQPPTARPVLTFPHPALTTLLAVVTC
jgi:hypothetical protein